MRVRRIISRNNDEYNRIFARNPGDTKYSAFNVISYCQIWWACITHNKLNKIKIIIHSKYRSSQKHKSQKIQR